MPDHDLPIKVESAFLADVVALQQLLADIAAWSRVAAVPMWANPHSVDFLSSFISRGEVFVVREAARVIATVTLTRLRDPYWDDEPPATAYLHRLAVSRTHAGRGLGASLIRWSEAHLRSQGVRTLRLDCDAANSRLVSFYSALGFTTRGDRRYDPYNMTFARFEKSL